MSRCGALTAYTMSTFRTVEGTVKNFSWTNPHARMILTVTGGNGATSEWEFEGGSIGRLVDSGFTKDTVNTGDKITVAYSPMRGGGTGGFFIAVTAADGKLYATDRYKNLKGTSGS
jgi:Family of unknown function (DUF6152)